MYAADLIKDAGGRKARTRWHSYTRHHSSLAAQYKKAKPDHFHPMLKPKRRATLQACNVKPPPGLLLSVWFKVAAGAGSPPDGAGSCSSIFAVVNLWKVVGNPLENDSFAVRGNSATSPTNSGIRLVQANPSPVLPLQSVRDDSQATHSWPAANSSSNFLRALIIRKSFCGLRSAIDGRSGRLAIYRTTILRLSPE